MNFDEEHNSLIDQYVESATEIERALFTRRYGLSEKHYSLLSVQSIAILYSYWEGYIQNSFQMYIDYLNEKNIPLRDYCDEIIVYHMENKFKQFREYPEKTKGKITFYDRLDEHFAEKRQDLYRVVNTESNVGFDVLNKLMVQFALEKFPEYWGKYKYPNQSLKDSLNSFIRYRNGVAHGGDISSEEKVTQEVYSRYRTMVNDLMYAIHDRFIEAIDHESYLNRGDVVWTKMQ